MCDDAVKMNEIIKKYGRPAFKQQQRTGLANQGFDRFPSQTEESAYDDVIMPTSFSNAAGENAPVGHGNGASSKYDVIIPNTSNARDLKSSEVNSMSTSAQQTESFPSTSSAAMKRGSGNDGTVSIGMVGLMCDQNECTNDGNDADGISKRKRSDTSEPVYDEVQPKPSPQSSIISSLKRGNKRGMSTMHACFFSVFTELTL